MNYAVGSLVRARGRDWVVLPETTDELVVARPLGGTDAETAGILTALEDIGPATFAPPTVADRGDHRSARMLRDALRLGVRSSAGPFRSFGDIAVEPRPYQLVPLLMALRLETVRLLIADDVGIGKTVEAGLIAKELLTTGDASGLAVLCPPHLAEQWQRELSEKFHLDAQLVLASTAASLERDLPVGTSIFEAYPITIVSLDFIKSDRHRDDFLRACPDLVIVDEAHTCADPAEGRGTRHQRHQLLEGLAADTERHLILVTATPHSGKIGAFRSLLALLDPAFEDLGDDISEGDLRRLARHLVQRRRGDIMSYLGETPFPQRERLQESYALSTEYTALFNDVLDFARSSVKGAGGARERVRWWSALGMLRALASSPAAAEATFTTRAANAESDDPQEVDEIGRLALFDDDSDADTETTDTAPGALIGPAGTSEPADAASMTGSDSELATNFAGFAERARALRGAPDAKVARVAKLVKKLVADGYYPIVFCRFIDTADYVAEQLRAKLPKKVTVESVTGLVPPAEREDRVEALAESPDRVLVATDCLSEGINLQHHFTAVIHYDLPWNPTRLEQREGRVDRFGQSAPTVRVATFVGKHVVDRIVEDVLIDKHLMIRRALGVSVPVPATSGEVLEALTDRLLTASDVEESAEQLRMDLPEVVAAFEDQWQAEADREKASRTRFAQHSIKVDEVQQEVTAAHQALGDPDTVRRFVVDAVNTLGGTTAPAGARTSANGSTGVLRLDLSETPEALRDRLALADTDTVLDAVFVPPADEGTIVLGRTHPLVAGLAGYVIDTALDERLDSVAARAGVIRTDAVTTRTHLLVLRNRYQLVARHQGRPPRPMLAEEASTAAFTGDPADPRWIDPEESLAALLDARVTDNVDGDTAADFLGEALASLEVWQNELAVRAQSGAHRLADSHGRVREQARMTGRVEVSPTLPVDVLGVYVLLPGTPVVNGGERR